MGPQNPGLHPRHARKLPSPLLTASSHPLSILKPHDEYGRPPTSRETPSTLAPSSPVTNSPRCPGTQQISFSLEHHARYRKQHPDEYCSASNVCHATERTHRFRKISRTSISPHCADHYNRAGLTLDVIGTSATATSIIEWHATWKKSPRSTTTAHTIRRVHNTGWRVTKTTCRCEAEGRGQIFNRFLSQVRCFPMRPVSCC